MSRRRRGRVGPWSLISLVILFGLAWGAVHLASGRALPAPDWVTRQIEARANAALGAGGQVRIGGLVAVLSERTVPRLVLRELRLLSPDGAEVLRIPELGVRLSGEALLGARFEPTRITVTGAGLTLRRDAGGRFGLDFGGASAAAAPGSVPELLALVEEIAARPALAGLREIAGESLRLTFEDALTGRVWQAANGRLALIQRAGQRSLTIDFALAGDAGAALADVRLSASGAVGSGALDLGARIEGVAADEVAAQLPALAWLAALDAPLSAALTGRMAPDGRFEQLAGALEIGAGAVTPEGAARPIRFDGARVRLAYEPEAGRIEILDASAATPEARFAATGQALLRAVDPASGLPGQLLVQLALADVALDPSGELAEPARFSRGAVDLRLTLDPLRVELGQLVLIEDDRHFRARGEIVAAPEGWDVALDVTLDTIPADRLVALWPLRVVPRTREWVAENVNDGQLADVRAALRLRPGAEPRLALGYEFSGADVRFLRTLPPVSQGAGHATIQDNRYTMVLREGLVIAPNGAPIRADGSVLVVPDVTERPSRAELRLETESSIPAALSLLDEPPFRLMTKAGRGTDLAEGQARLSSVIRLPLVQGIQLEDVEFATDGVLSGVRSEVLVPGRVLEAEALTLSASGEGIVISGSGRVGGAAFDASWSQVFGPEAAEGSRVEGGVTLDQAFLDEFGIALPRGSVAGAGLAQVTLELPREAPARFRLVSDLNRLALSIPALGWSKDRAATGRLEVAGALGSPPVIERLALQAPGLEAEGTVELAADGSLAAARLSRLRAGGWLDAPVTLTGRGAGRAPAVAVSGGTIDLRRTGMGGAGSDAGGPLSLSRVRLTVSDGIVFHDLRADLSTQGGLSGRFTARLADAAPVAGTLAPTREGTAVRLQAEDAGAVLRAAGLLQSARQGTMDLTLLPLPGEGRYDGRVAISGLRLRGAPALADLLSAVSVVGLLEQLNGQGIVFNEVSGEFTLEPQGITLRRGSAVGASLGVSMSGVYDLRSQVMDMQGTISPIYLINSIGSIFTRRGEGLFGFNYRMTGPASAPRTQVNPLSILTPGMFREIFRAAPPRLSQ